MWRTARGCGDGGSCFPKDVRAVAQTARAHGYEPRILPAVDDVNEAQKEIQNKELKIETRLYCNRKESAHLKTDHNYHNESEEIILIRTLLTLTLVERAQYFPFLFNLFLRLSFFFLRRVLS